MCLFLKDPFTVLLFYDTKHKHEELFIILTAYSDPPSLNHRLKLHSECARNIKENCIVSSRGRNWVCQAQDLGVSMACTLG